MAIDLFNEVIEKGFQVRTLHHAEAILKHDMPDAARELEELLLGVRIPIIELVRGGGGEAQLTQRMRKVLAASHGWKKHRFEIKKVVDGQEKECISHEIDHVKFCTAGTIALELEWNNKDPFFDRDLENFKRLHADGVISIGVIVTRGTSLQNGLKDKLAAFARNNKFMGLTDLEPFMSPTKRQQELYAVAARRLGSFPDGWASAFVADKFGEATTHWRKLEDRVNRGVGNPCPLVLVGIPLEVIEE